MKKRWNMMGKMAVCSFAAMMMVTAGTGMKASAEMIIDSEDEMQTEAQAVMDIVPESEFQEVLPADAPAAEDTQEAGDLGIDITQIVVIEDSQVPGAALPDFDPAEEQAEAGDLQYTEVEEPEAGEEQAETKEPEADEAADGEQDEEMAGAEQAEAEEPQNTDAEAEEQQAAPEEKSETSVPRMITYEDSEVVVTVAASEAAQLPADTEVKVTKLEEGSEKYEAAKEAARQSVGASENASYTFYDVTLESEGQALDVEEGTVSVRMEFKTDAAKREVVSIEETENGKVARNVTDRAAAGRDGSVALSYKR